MTIDWVAILAKVPEMAALVIVVYFALQLTADNRKNSGQVMSDWRTWLTDQQKAHREYCERQESRFIGALSEIREDNSEVITELTAQIKDLGEKVNEMGTQLATITAILSNTPRRSSKP